MAPKKSQDAAASPAASEKKPRTSTPSRRRSSTNLKAKAKKAVGPSKVNKVRLAISSTSKYTTYFAYLMAIVPSFFFILSIVDPKQNLKLLELDYPILPKQQHAAQLLIMVIGSRDFFMTNALLLALYFGTRKLAGFMFFSVGLQAFLDGAIVYLKTGKGLLTHWGYLPILAFIGTVLTGFLDP